MLSVATASEATLPASLLRSMEFESLLQDPWKNRTMLRTSPKLSLTTAMTTVAAASKVSAVAPPEASPQKRTMAGAEALPYPTSLVSSCQSDWRQFYVAAADPKAKGRFLQDVRFASATSIGKCVRRELEIPDQMPPHPKFVASQDRLLQLRAKIMLQEQALKPLPFLAAQRECSEVASKGATLAATGGASGASVASVGAASVASRASAAASVTCVASGAAGAAGAVSFNL